MGEGFVSSRHPSPILARGSAELPSPAAEVGFIRLRPSLKVPELGQARVRVGEGAVMPTASVGLFTCQTALLVPAAHFLHPGFATLLHQSRIEGWAERRETLGCSAEHPWACHLASKTRVNALMTRDARLSALHRGDFSPGAALPCPALPPDPCSELLAA